MSTVERVIFRLLIMPCCSHQLCWVNPRLPIFCPECGSRPQPDQVRVAVVFRDDKAELHHGRD